MSKQEKLSPGFSISHNAEEEFPSSSQREELGYDEFDLFLNSGLPEDEALDPRFLLSGQKASDFTEPVKNDIYLVFRYKRSDFNLNSRAGIPTGPNLMPVFQREFFPASITPNEDFHVLAEILEDSLESVTDAEYIYDVSLNELETTTRCTTVERYLDELSGRELKIFPEAYGVHDIILNPREFNAIIEQYSQEVEVYRDNGTGARKETVNLNYDTSEIDEIEDSLNSEGFKVIRELLPSEIHPEGF